MFEKIDSSSIKSPNNVLPSTHSPGRSKTVSAWGALIAFILLITAGFFYSFLLKESLRVLLWASRPFTGITIQAEVLPVVLGKPLRWKHMAITAGLPPHESRLELQTVSLELASPWRMLFGDHTIITKIEASTGKGLLDFRKETLASNPSFFQQQAHRFHELLQRKINELPESVIVRDISLLCMTQNQRYSITHFSCFLPKKEPGQLSYESMQLEAGTIRCHLPPTSCEAAWDGKTVLIKNLPLAEGIRVHRLQATPHPDRLELGFAATAFHGSLRADGCLKKNGDTPTLEGALLGQQLPIESLSKFLGLQKKISGTVREGRLIFRGSPLHPIDAEASLRMMMDHVRIEKKDWASLSIAANLIGRKMSVTDFLLKQQENRITIVGEMSLPEEWHKIGQAPFHLRLKAAITDASQLADFIVAPWNDIAGHLSLDGEVTGAANRAEGYLHVQGSAMMLHELPIDAIESTLLFQGEKTVLSNLDLWNGNDHLQLSGSMNNSWPHHYEAQGAITAHHFLEKWKSLEGFFNTANAQESLLNEETNNDHSSSQREEHKHINPYLLLTTLRDRLASLNIHGGLLQAHWNGHGTATMHEGAFELKLQEATQENHPFHLYSTGSYTPEFLTCPVLVIHSGAKTFSTSLVLSSQALSLTNLTLHENKRCTLAGTVSLPLHGIKLLQGAPLSSLLQWETALDVNLTLQHCSLNGIVPPTTSLSKEAWIDGSIKASGPWNEPSLEVMLHGEKNASVKNNNTFFSFQLSSQKGNGSVNAFLRNENDKEIKLQGTLPLGLSHVEESAPLKTKNELILAPLSTPFHLTLTLPESHIDLFAKALLPQDVTIHRASLAGEIALQGTSTAPELLGHLTLKAEKWELYSMLEPLQAVQATFLMNKEKVLLENASALLGQGKITVSGASTGRLGELHHEYSVSGRDLLLYQHGQTAVKGTATLLLQGNSQGGTLSGNLDITELHWKPQLTITPFLLPPGLLFQTPLSPLNSSSSWVNNLTVRYQPDKTASASFTNNQEHSSLQKIDLHLLGPLFSPAPEGTVIFSNLAISSPRSSMEFLQGEMRFQAAYPWRPHFQLSAEATVNQHPIVTHLADTATTPSLFFESAQPRSQETAALLLAQPSSDSNSALFSGWFAQLPYWVRQQEIEERTNITDPTPPLLVTPEQRKNYLGFTGTSISYHGVLR